MGGRSPANGKEGVSRMGSKESHEDRSGELLETVQIDMQRGGDQTDESTPFWSEARLRSSARQYPEWGISVPETGDRLDVSSDRLLI